jgi:hypothetical protein
MLDGVAKTHQLLRCCNGSRHCGVPEYASFLDNCAPCIWRFLLRHSLFGFLAKAVCLMAEFAHKMATPSSMILEDV